MIDLNKTHPAFGETPRHETIGRERALLLHPAKAAVVFAIVRLRNGIAVWELQVRVVA